MNFFVLYIDPGTGSMLFSILIGVVSTLVFFGRKLMMKMKFVISGGKAARLSNMKIPYVIFSDHKRYWNVFKPICDEFEKRGVPLVYWTASPDDPMLSEKYETVKTEFIGEGNKAFARLNMMNAGIVLSTTPGLDVYQWKRSKTADYYVHIPHTADELLGYRMFGMDFYDAVLLTGDFQGGYIRQVEKMRGIPQKELVTVGCTYLDTMKSRFESIEIKKESSVPTILLAPSWGESAILAKYGSKIIDALLQTGFNLIIRPHPQTVSSEREILEPLLAAYPDSDCLEWNYDNDNFSVLAKSDIMITDFSGIILDYTFIFGKPLLYADTSFDSAPYDAAWFDEENWRLKILPELGIRLDEKDFPNMKAVIERALHSEQFRQNRKRISGEAWQNKGGAAQAVADYLIGKKNEIDGTAKESGSKKSA